MAILYPPIIDTYMPAFIVNDGQGTCRVYFSLSQFNNPTDIKAVCITVNNQYTNQSMLNTNSGFLFFDGLKEELSRDGDDRYYVNITQNDLIDKSWEVNEVYKVQIRLSSVPMDTDPTINNVIVYQHSFSEWSTVCLIQGIEQPRLILNGFTDSDGDITFTSYDKITGRVEFTDEETLKSYRVRIFNVNDEHTCVYDSDVIYSNSFAPNEINHAIKYGFIEGEQYILKFTYTTSKLYEATEEYKFLIVDFGGQPLKATITATPLDDAGRIAVRITSNEEGFIGNITIRRTSNKSNFTIWEDVYTTPISTELELDYTWYDTTAESGVWYKYCVQRRSAYGNRGLVVLTESPVMITMQDMFLVRGDKQLKIKFNPQINSFKHTVSESLTQTLGSKYPFIKRNANVHYKEFSISGLISHFCDDENLFMAREEMYQHQEALYQKYNEKNWITEYNDFTLERNFRDKVIEFLYENNVKLFKSPSEGNVLVRLMNVSFNPEPTLGRMVYSFSATAYEIDEANIDNYTKYGIWDIGTFSNQIINSYIATGYYNGVIQDDIPSKQWGGLQWHDLVDLTQDIATGRESTLKKDIQYLTDVSLEITGKPYLIKIDALGLAGVLRQQDTPNESSVLGYLISVNHKPVIVGPSGKYNISNAKITSLGFLAQMDEVGSSKPIRDLWKGMPNVKTEVSINYSYEVIEREKVEIVPYKLNYISKVGQVWGYVKPMEDIFDYIKDKASYSDTYSYQKLFGVSKITVEADPGTVLYVRDDSSESFKRYIIGDTGSLMIGEGSSFNINAIYALGKHLDLFDPFRRIMMRDTEYNLVYEPRYNYLKDVVDPQERNVYLNAYTWDTSSFAYHPGTNIDTSLSEYHAKMAQWMKPSISADYRTYATSIYYNGQWYPFIEETGDIIMPTPQILIDYSYEVEKGEYKSA